MFGKYKLGTDPSNLPYIRQVKDLGDRCFYDVTARLVAEEGGMRLVNPKNGKRIFDLPSNARGLEQFREKFEGRVIINLPVIYLKSWDVALPNTYVRRKP